MSLVNRVMSNEDLEVIIDNLTPSSILRSLINTSKNGTLKKVNVLVPC